MRHPARWVWGTVGALVLIEAVLLTRHYLVPRIVGRAVSPEGIEMCVLQKFNWSGEPYTTSFMYRVPGTNWAWCYYGHQDDHWASAPVRVDTNQGIATFFREGRPALSFEWGRRVYKRGRDAGTPGGGEPNEPSYMPSEWTPRAAGYR